jgi:hypothetical protein
MYSEMVDKKIEEVSYAEPEGPESDEDKQKRLHKSNLYLGLFFMEYMRFGRPVGVLDHPHTTYRGADVPVSIITHGGITGPNRQNHIFYPTNPIYCLPPLSVRAREKIKKALDDSSISKIPHVDQIIVPHDRSLYFANRREDEFALKLVSLMDATKIFSGLGKQEFDSAMSLCYFGVVHAEQGMDQGVAFCLDTKLRG